MRLQRLWPLIERAKLEEGRSIVELSTIREKISQVCDSGTTVFGYHDDDKRLRAQVASRAE